MKRNVLATDFIIGAGDVSPEGLTAFSRKGRHFLAVSHEVSHSTTLYEVAGSDVSDEDDEDDDD